MHFNMLKLQKNPAIKKRVYLINPSISQIYLSKEFFFSENSR